MQAGTYRSLDAGQIKFSDYIDRWFARQRHLAGGTRDRDASHIENHLKPRWGNYEIADITIEEVEDWVLALDESYARKTVLDIYGIFRRSMDYAVERRYLSHLPYPRSINLARDRGRAKQPAYIENEADLWRLADSIVPHWRAWVLTAGYLGLRPGECHGITRTNLDLQEGWLTVAGAVKEHGTGRPYYEAVTKDQRVWMKPLPAFLIEVLSDHVESYPFHSEFVFTTPKGLLIRKRNFYRRWYEALERARLPRMTPHSLRHTCSSLLDGKGVSVKERMDYVGHSTVTMQLHYTHVGAERLKQIADTLDRHVREHLEVGSLIPPNGRSGLSRASA
ncbi:MAG: site-specific integrase [Actinomycetota bacterium]|nr:site-specific integrase [Actinomycetota bacterium]